MPCPCRSSPENIDIPELDLDLLITAADEFRDSELPEPTAAAEKHSLPDDDEGGSNTGDEENELDDENEAGLE